MRGHGEHAETLFERSVHCCGLCDHSAHAAPAAIESKLTSRCPPRTVTGTARQQQLDAHACHNVVAARSPRHAPAGTDRSPPPRWCANPRDCNAVHADLVCVCQVATSRKGHLHPPYALLVLRALASRRWGLPERDTCGCSRGTNGLRAFWQRHLSSQKGRAF